MAQIHFIRYFPKFILQYVWAPQTWRILAGRLYKVEHSKKCPTAKFSHFCALDVASADNYFHRGVCACSAEDTNKNMEYSTSQQVHKRASLGFRCAQWLQLFGAFKNLLFKILHDRETLLQKNTIPCYHLFAWIVAYYCCPLLKCNWLSS